MTTAPTRPRPLATLALAIFLAPAATAAADPKPVAHLFTPSDLPRLAERGFQVPSAGTYTVVVWAPARQTWTLKNDGATLALRVRTQGEDGNPRWQSVGTADLKGGGRVTVRVEGSERKDEAKEKEKAKGKGQETAKVPTRPAPVPALLVVTTDPKFDPAPALDLVRGRVDSVDPPADPRRDHVRTNQQGANFEPPATAQAWRDRARHVREQLLVTTGLAPGFPRTPLKPEVRGKLERDGYTIENVVLETFPGFTLGGNLYRPAGPPRGKRPAVLCPHGHWADGRVNPEVQQRCIRLAKLGFVVYLYDMVGYNDSKPFGHAFLNDRLRRWGLSLVTLQTWDSLRALDWLAARPDVDPARIGCTGESGGGTQTFLLTALDDRVAAAAPVVMVSDSFQGGCVCENCAGLRLGTDNVEFAALTAPRPLKLVGATGDWTAKTMTNAYPTIEKVYRLVGTPDRVSADLFDFPHNYNQTSRNAVYPFFARWLQGNTDAASTREGEQTTEKPEVLWAFTGATPAPPDRKTPEALERDLIATLTRQLDALAPSDSSARWEAARGLLGTVHRVRVGLENPPPGALIAAEMRRVSREGFQASHLVVGRKSVGENVPVLRLIPPKPSGKLTVIASPHGKAALIEPDGTPGPLAAALLSRGQSVVGFDPLLVGESVDPSSPARRRPGTAHFDAYNPSLAEDRMQDLATVLAWARSLPEVREVSLVGHGRSGPSVLLARPALEGLARTAVDLQGFSEGDGSSPLPDDVDLPGLFQFGGLKAAAALAAPAPLWVIRAGRSFDRSWPDKAYGLADAASALKIDADRPAPDDLARWIDTGESAK